MEYEINYCDDKDCPWNNLKGNCTYDGPSMCILVAIRRAIDCPHNEGNIGTHCIRCGEDIFNGHGD